MSAAGKEGYIHYIAQSMLYRDVLTTAMPVSYHQLCDAAVHNDAGDVPGTSMLLNRRAMRLDQQTNDRPT